VSRGSIGFRGWKRKSASNMGSMISLQAICIVLSSIVGIP
jgi:hypothetical protein